jgi:hypothetical protein
MTDQVLLSGDQAESLREALGHHCDGEQVLLTQQGDGSIVVAFNLATFTISPNGEVVE